MANTTRQTLAARSIIGAAIRPLERLTAQAELDLESQQGDHVAAVLTRIGFAAASPHVEWPPQSNRTIVIWYGEELSK